MLIVKGNRSHNTAAFTTPYNFCQKKCCHSNIAREDWKVLKLKPTQLTKEESEKLLKKVNKVLSEVNLYKGLNTDNILDIATNDLIYIAKYNLFFDNTKIAEKKIHHYETKSMTIKKYLAHTISAIMSK